jgi:hypothetical protein
MVTTNTLIEDIFKDRIKRIEYLLEIEDKQKNLVPMKLKYIQKQALLEMTGRDIIVKPSQVGFSSAVIGDWLLDTIINPGTVSVIISHEEFITQRLLLKAQAYYDHLQSRISSVPEMYHKSSNLKTFPSIHSSFYIGSARSAVFGRGETIHNLFCDEYAFWEEDAIERIMGPASQRVPITGRIVVGSTPNGEGNAFHELYIAAKEGIDIGKSVYTAHFYPWFLHEEYTLAPDSEFVLPGDNTVMLDLTDEEAMLVDNYGLTHDQIRWRRRKVAEFESLRHSGESRILFSQEYPEDDVSCFLTSGEMAYDSDLLNSMAKKCYTTKNIHETGAKIWYPPEPNLRYVVACDVGVAKQSETVITIIHVEHDKDGREHIKHCASLSGLIMPNAAAKLAKKLGWYYNRALITWDAASQGIAFGDEVNDYGHIYYREDLQSGRTGRVPGWLTTPRTKLYMYDQITRMLPYTTTHDINLISQLKNMRMIDDKLVSVGLDDFHDSFGIALSCRGSIPTTRGFSGTAGWSKF